MTTSLSTAEHLPVYPPNPSATAFFHQQIWPILRERCLSCHGEAKQKGSLRLDSLEHLMRGGEGGAVVVPGEPERSQLVKSVRWSGDQKMPPKERLPEAQVAALARWVELGAPWAAPIEASATAASAASATAAGPAGSMPAPSHPPLAGRLHPLVVHFPIACLMLAALAELLAWRRRQAWDGAVGLLVGIGALSAIAAVVSGLWFAGDQSPELLEPHERLGWCTLAVAVLATATWLVRDRHPALRWVLRGLLVIAAALVSATGHFGGQMAYGKGFPFL